MAFDSSELAKLRRLAEQRAERQQIFAELGRMASQEADFDRLMQQTVDRVACALGGELAKVLELISAAPS